jgi:hypothetical protein
MNRWKQYNNQRRIVQMENTLSEFKTVIQGFLVRKDQKEKRIAKLRTGST